MKECEESYSFNVVSSYGDKIIKYKYSQLKCEHKLKYVLYDVYICIDIFYRIVFVN